MAVFCRADEVLWRRYAVAGEEIVVRAVAIDHATDHPHRRQIAVALGDVLRSQPDALVEGRGLGHDVAHVVGPQDVLGVLVHVVRCDQVAPIPARTDAGIAGGAGLLRASSKQRNRSRNCVVIPT